MPKLNAMHLNGLRAVETVARRGSLKEAAMELSVSPSAISQQVNRTEAQLGQTVFERTGTGLRLTPFGRALSARLTAGFRELEEAVALADETQTNTLVVSVAPAFASKWLLPRLSRHFARHPSTLLRIDASVGLIDLNHSDVDVAIRLGKGDWPGVRAELLMAQEIFPVCTPGMAWNLTTPADLARSTVITDENSMITWQRWFEEAKIEPVELLPGARFTDPTLCLESVIAGHGVMLGWQLLTADALADGRLVAPFGIRATSGLGYWVVTSATRRESRKVKDFKIWLREEIDLTASRFAAPSSGVS